MLRGDTREFPEGDTELNHREAEQMKTNEGNLYNQTALFLFLSLKQTRNKIEPTQKT